MLISERTEKNYHKNKLTWIFMFTCFVFTKYSHYYYYLGEERKGSEKGSCNKWLHKILSTSNGIHKI